MKIPSNKTEKETLDIIEIVINRVSPRYIFPGYEIEDIKQQAFIICLEALERYDENRPLENFLSHNLSNRLKNFVRDNFYLKKDSESKKNILKPLPIEEGLNISYEQHSSMVMDLSKLINIIDSKLPIHLREDYLKFTSGAYLPKLQRDELLNVLRNICEENGITEEEFYGS